MLVTPSGETAYLLTDRFSAMTMMAVAMGTLASFLGAYASYFLNGSTGGCIVVLQTSLFLLALTFGPKHGVLAARRKARSPSASLSSIPASLAREIVRPRPLHRQSGKEIIAWKLCWRHLHTDS